MGKLASIALIFISIVEESIAHANHTHIVFGFNSIPQLFEPHPII